jgi:uncharacterized protein
LDERVVIVLGVIIAASVIANVYLYQKSTSLEGEISQLHAANKDLTNIIARNNQTSTMPPPTGSIQPAITGTLPTSPNTNQSNGNNNYESPLNYTSQSITAVAVRAVPVTDGFFESMQYQGTTMEIGVDIRDGGKGLVLVNTEIPTGVDFQTSARTAVKVAQSMTGADLSNKDVIFSITATGNSTSSDLQAVDGPSAGAAMTVLLAAELGSHQPTDKNSSTGLKRSVVMTGTVNPDGTIGPVGGVPEKAMAAGQYGAKVFLVPPGQNVYTEQNCQKRQEGPVIYQSCQSQQKPLSDYTEKNYAMKVIEVKDIKEALAYFQSD